MEAHEGNWDNPVTNFWFLDGVSIATNQTTVSIHWTNAVSHDLKVVHNSNAFDGEGNPLHQWDGQNTNITVNVIKVDMDLKPKGVGDYESLPDPIQIAAGGFASPVHQADVVIRVEPAIAGIPISLGLLNGVGHERHAKLEVAGMTTFAGGGTIVVETGTGGVIEGVLTSSDSEDICTVFASLSGSDCQESQSVEFNWIWMDAFDVETDWLIEPTEIIGTGIYTNILRLRHHRAEELDAPVLPLDQHEIRFFVEKVKYIDEEGEEQVIVNTADNTSTNVNEWAVFVEPAVTDADGVATAELDIKKIDGLVYLELVAYDWSVYGAPPIDAATEPDEPMAMSIASLTSTPDERETRKTIFLNNTALKEGLRPALVRYPLSYIPVVSSDIEAEQQAAGYILFYRGNESQTTMGLNKRLKIYDNNSGLEDPWRLAYDHEAKLGQVQDFESHDLYYSGPDEYSDRFCLMKIYAYTNAHFRLKTTSHNKFFNYQIEFRAVSADLEFIGPNRPLMDISSGTSYHIAPKQYYASSQAEDPTSVAFNVKLKHNVTDPSGFASRFDSLDGLDAIYTLPTTISGTSEITFEALAEGEAESEGKFLLGSYYNNNMIIVGLGTPLTMEVDETQANQVVQRAGCIEPANFIVADMKIAKPTGATPPVGELGSTADPATSPLFVFDTPVNLGKCAVRCEAAPLDGLSDENKALVWSLLEWKLPDFSSVSGVTNDNVTTFTYEGMPTHTDQFGNTNITLRFKEREHWAYHQPVQFRYNRTGTGAADQHHGELNNVTAGNPNWYVYWQQVANQFSGEGSGLFGPQTSMEYNNADHHPEDEQVLGAYVVSFGGSTWNDKIVMYKGSGANRIVDFIRLLHHENGHLHSAQLPAAKGGWGDGAGGLAYNGAFDSDGDGVRDSWENSAYGQGLGFVVSDPPPDGAEARALDMKRREAWDHGWDSLEEAAAGSAAGNYTNPEGHQEATGRGLCRRNEDHVNSRNGDIWPKDWSHKMQESGE